mmetsp:Transcript_49474/g.142330  ORF Transcript_49474/g.142330 Transcript_49474/m.142330 type:complete len:205 (-) Transcript_49474:543-1157(-)
MRCGSCMRRGRWLRTSPRSLPTWVAATTTTETTPLLCIGTERHIGARRSTTFAPAPWRPWSSDVAAPRARYVSCCGTCRMQTRAMSASCGSWRRSTSWKANGLRPRVASTGCWPSILEAPSGPRSCRSASTSCRVAMRVAPIEATTFRTQTRSCPASGIKHRRPTPGVHAKAEHCRAVTERGTWASAGSTRRPARNHSATAGAA